MTRDKRDHLTELARLLTGKDAKPGRVELTASSTAGGGTVRDTRVDRLPLPLGSLGDVLTVVDDAGDTVAAWAAPTGGGGGSIELDEGGAPVVATLATIDFDASDFNTADAGGGVGTVALNYGTGAGQPAEGNHSHASILPIAESDVTSLVTDLANKQPLDSDLTAIAALTPTNDDVVQRKAGAWTNRTVAQLVADFNPMTTQDDLIVGGASGVLARLGKGGDGQVLTVDPSTHHLVWATPTTYSSYADPLTTKGDLLVHTTVTTRKTAGADGYSLVADSAQADGLAWVDRRPVSLVWTIKEGGVPATGLFAVLHVPFACTVTDWIVESVDGVTGSITLDIKTADYSTSPTFSSIVGAGTKPALSSATKARMANLTSWTTAVAADTLVALNIDSASDLSFVMVSLVVART